MHSLITANSRCIYLGQKNTDDRILHNVDKTVTDCRCGEIPKSEHEAGNCGIIVVKTVITDSSPDAVVTDFQST